MPAKRPFSPSAQRAPWILLVILIVALLLRLLFLLEMRRNPFFDFPVLAAGENARIASTLADSSADALLPASRAPLYPAWLGFLHWLLGRQLLWIRGGQLALGALATWLTYRLGRRAFDSRTALLASALVAGCGSLIFFSEELLPVSLTILLAPFFLLSLLWAVERPTPWRWLGAGAALGLLALACPPAVLLALPAMYEILRAAGPGLPRRSLGFVAFLAGLTLLAGPAALHHFQRGGDLPSLLRGGVRATAATTATRDDNALGRLLGTVHGAETGGNQSLYPFRAHSRVLSVLVWPKWIYFPWGVLLPLALLGAALAFRRAPASRPLLRMSGLLALVLLTLPAGSDSRQPLIPVLALLAAMAMIWAYDRFRQRRIRPLAAAAIPLLPLLVAVNWPRSVVTSEFDADALTSLGIHLLEEGSVTSASAAFTGALEQRPGHPEANIQRGILWLQENRPDEARRCFSMALLMAPGEPRALAHLGTIQLSQGEVEAAFRSFSAALQTDPQNETARGGLAALRGASRQGEAIGKNPKIAGLIEQLRRQGENAAILTDLGGAYVEAGYPDLAVPFLKRAIGHAPRLAQAHNNLGVALAQLGDLEQAASAFSTALTLQPDFTEARENLERINRPPAG
ncbi:MAG TPA: tetratricopeptide repeat protein [Candidatus Aminicenantes bacterium]|nr:tetratricopeptide repeat protein [Candidatus Aminicenantes bacterium]